MCLWSLEKTSSQASHGPWNLPALCVSLPYTGGKPLVIKSGRAICGHSWNRKAVVGMGEAPKLVGLWQQKLCQCIGSSCVPGRAVHEAPPDVAGEAVREWSLLL